MQDAAKLSGLPCVTFSHCDVDSLRDVLKRHARSHLRPLLVTDGVFATTGRIPPLAAYAQELEHYGGHLFVDESHGFGVIGKRGRGAAEHCEVEHVAATGATLSKAFCAQGAVVACSESAAVRLRNIPVVRGACAGSPLSAAAAAASIEYVFKHPEFREQVRDTAQYLRTELLRLGLEVIHTPAPIVSFRWGKRADMQALQNRLFDQGIFVQYSTYIGAGPEGMIRCAVFRDHSREDIDALITALKS